ncbi:PAS domain S-box-containing protein [Desulfobotulus alkaliphilus]|uniref:histidine kinase n=1 Tax=Desulfobotulus alkaliphilus TaxID=622671 RepID=A0A562RXE4_9BACT|nr:PAS domain S-box protein [Desulfobotulus alkaliphilus]TWI72990.1 PAS domain S-box-containing protein [Desulfobotulus alkaliphilus]
MPFTIMDYHGVQIFFIGVPTLLTGILCFVLVRLREQNRLLVQKKKEYEDSFRRFFTANRIPMALTNLETGLLEDVNPSFLEVTGYAKEEILGRTSLDLGIIKAEERNRMKALLAEKGALENIRVHIPVKSHEKKFYTCFGEAILMPPGNKVLCIARDIHLLLTSRQLLADQENLLDTIFRNTPDFLILKDRNFVFKKVTPSFFNYFKDFNMNSSIEGKTDFDFFPEEKAKEHRKEDEEILVTGKTMTISKAYQSDIGRRWYHIIKAPIKDVAGEASGILCTIRDVTAEKRMEMLLEARLRISELKDFTTSHGIIQKIIEIAGEITESGFAFFCSRNSSLMKGIMLHGPDGFFHNENLHQSDALCASRLFTSCREKGDVMVCNRNSIPDLSAFPGVEEIHSVILLPLFEKKQLVGFFGAGNKDTDYDEQDRDILRELAHMGNDIIKLKRTEEKWIEVRRILQNIADYFPGMIFRSSASSGWIMEHVTGTCEQLTGYAAEVFSEEARLPFSALIHPEDKKKLEATLARSFLNNQPYEKEYRIFHKNGMWRWVLERGVGVYAENGRVVSIEGVITDIHEYVEIRKNLRRQETMMKTMLDGISDMVILFKNDFSIQAINRAGASVVGKSPEEVRGMKCYELIQRSAPCEGCAVKEAIDTGTNAKKIQFNSFFNAWFDYNAMVVKGVDDENPVVIAQMRNVSNRIKKDQELRMLESAMQQTAEMILITDNNGRIQYVNSAIERVTGYTAAEMVGMHPRMLAGNPPSMPPSHYRKMWQVLRSGRTWQGRFNNRKKSGENYTEQASITPILDETGTIVSFVGVSTDITEELQREYQVYQAHRMEAIGSLAGGIAHDLNNILFPLMGYAGLIREAVAEDSQLTDYINEIFIASGRARDLVKHILTFSRNVPEEKVSMDMQVILREVLHFSRASIPSTIRIRNHIDAACRPVWADSTQMHRVFINLVANAFQAMEKDGGILTLSLEEIYLSEDEHPILPEGFYACAGVKDTGTGIDPSILDKIFDPYFTTKGKDKGTGLGLSLVHAMVCSHGGHIDVKSTPGEGTHFLVYIPCIMDNQGMEKSDPEEKFSLSSPDLKGSEHILVLDDEEPIARMLTHMLELLGYTVTMFTRVSEALEAVFNDSFACDLVITDMTMPDMRGEEVCARIKNIRPDLPLIMFTGRTDLVQDENPSSMGFAGIITKPAKHTEVAVKIREILDRKNHSSL